MSTGAIDFLRGRGRFAPDARPGGGFVLLAGYVVAGGLVYGAVMGSYTGLLPAHHLQPLVSGIKVPLLIGATFVLCLPSFFVLNLLAGLGQDIPDALRAVSSTLAAVAIVLAALAPITGFFYLAVTDYGVAVTLNGVAFFVASLGAVPVVRRYYGPLVKRDPRHRQMLAWWFVIFVFTGIQMGWVLRPFIGDPDKPVALFRAKAWGNAYVVILNLIGHSAGRF